MNNESIVRVRRKAEYQDIQQLCDVTFQAVLLYQMISA